MAYPHRGDSVKANCHAMLTAAVSRPPDPTYAVQACDRFVNSLDEEGFQALAHHLDMCSDTQVRYSRRLYLSESCGSSPFHADVFDGLGEAS